jgi:hypothetical protein
VPSLRVACCFLETCGVFFCKHTARDSLLVVGSYTTIVYLAFLIFVKGELCFKWWVMRLPGIGHPSHGH